MRHRLRLLNILGLLPLAWPLLATAANAEPAPQPPPSAYTVSWVGNSFALKLDPESDIRAHVLDRTPSDLYVFPDGTLTTNAGFDEHGADSSVYTADGDMTGQQSGRGDAVTGDGAYIYRSGDNGDPGRGEKNWIVRWRSADRMTYWQHDWGSKKWSRMRIDEKAHIAGLAVKDGELYVSDSAASTVKVYRLDAFPPPGTDLKGPVQAVRSFPLERPGHLAFDDAGRLWAIQTCVRGETKLRDDGGKPGERWYNNQEEWGLFLTPGRVAGIDPKDGRVIATIDDFTEPMDLAFSSKDKLLLVAERGRDHQIRFYSDLAVKPKLARTFGAKGGIYASGGVWGKKGEVKPGKLHPPTGVGVDAKGNLYVSGGTGCNFWPVVIESYAPDGKLRWQRSCQMFSDSAWYDPVEDNMYTSLTRMGMDWSKTAPGSEWSYQGLMADFFTYPQDPRCPRMYNSSEIIRVVHKDGHKLLYDGSSNIVNVFRFTPESGEVGIWCAAVGSGDGPLRWGTYVWSDRNGNARMDLEEIQKGGTAGARGKDVDEQGGIWLPAADHKGIVHYPLDGIDANGIAKYSVETMKVYPIPEDNPFRDAYWGENPIGIQYDAAADTLVLSGFTYDYPHHTEYGNDGFGRLLVLYRNFTTKPVKAWQVLVPRHELHNDKPRSMAMAGNYVFVAYIKNQRVEIYRKADGAYVGPLDPYQVPGLNNGTLIDHHLGLRAGVRKNGEYVLGVFDSLDGKAFLYRWMPSKDTPAKPPAPPVLVAVGGDREIAVRWDKVASAVEYRLYRGLTPGNETLYKDHLKQAEYVDVGAADGKSYSYRASAVNAQGESPLSFWFMAQAYGVSHLVPGRIEAENFDQGGEGVGFHAPPAKNGADKDRRWKLYRPDEGAPIGSEGLGRLMSGNYSTAVLMPGAWWRYTLEVAAPGDYTVVLRAQTNEKDRKVRVQIDGAEAGVIAVLPTHERRDDYKYRFMYWGETAIENVALKKGKQVLTLVAEGDGILVDRIEVFPTGKPSPYFGVPAAVPGLIEAEYFDRGGEGVGFHREKDKKTVTKPSFEYPINSINDWCLTSVAAIVLRPLERTMPIRLVEGDETKTALREWGGNFCLDGWEGDVFPSWTAYTVNVAQAGPYDITFRFNGPDGSEGRGVNYQLLLDDQELVNQVDFKGKAEAGKWEHALPSVKLPAGMHVLKVVRKSGAGGGLDWMRMAKCAAEKTPEAK